MIPILFLHLHKWAQKPISNQRVPYPRKFECNGLENKSCKAVRWQYFCEGNCSKIELDDKICCKYGKNKKMVIFFEGAHTCKNTLYKVSSMEDVETRVIENYYKNYTVSTGSKELPADLNKNHVYVLPLQPEDEKTEKEQVKCGREFGEFKSLKPSEEESRIFGPYVTFQKKRAHCKGFFKCKNHKCPYFERFNAVNQVIILK